MKEHLFFHAVTKMSNHFTKEQMAARIEAVRGPSLPPPPLFHSLFPASFPFALLTPVYACMSSR